MRTFALIIFSLILFTSCEKSEVLSVDDQKTGKPDIPVNDSIDVNSDQIADFVFIYQELSTYDLPSSAGTIKGTVIPLQQNKLLYRKDVGYLFLEVNDTIRKSGGANSNWQGFGADLIHINRHYQNWDSNWTVIGDKKPFYFLAYKLIIHDSEVIGWISLNFDTETGTMSITDGDNTDNNELIIYKKNTN